jgi:alpha/beta superfamily hydrolase
VSERLRISGTRDLQATRDGPADAAAAVVACPPHPQMGGSRSDARLRAVGDALAERGIACLRIDFGPWDEGQAEQGDVRDSLAWAREEYPTVALFGYSFGAGVALLAAADADPEPAALSVLAPPATIVEDGDVVAAVEAVDERGLPGQVVYGERDTTVDWDAVVEAARECGWPCEAVPGDHFFVGQHGRAADLAATHLATAIQA